jgi:hypothetical protein
MYRNDHNAALVHIAELERELTELKRRAKARSLWSRFLAWWLPPDPPKKTQTEELDLDGLFVTLEPLQYDCSTCDAKAGDECVDVFISRQGARFHSHRGRPVRSSVFTMPELQYRCPACCAAPGEPCSADRFPGLPKGRSMHAARRDPHFRKGVPLRRKHVVKKLPPP